jgi:hypothetical protein
MILLTHEVDPASLTYGMPAMLRRQADQLDEASTGDRMSWLARTAPIVARWPWTGCAELLMTSLSRLFLDLAFTFALKLRFVRIVGSPDQPLVHAE